jgi:hypothetical protein
MHRKLRCNENSVELAPRQSEQIVDIQPNIMPTDRFKLITQHGAVFLAIAIAGAALSAIACGGVDGAPDSTASDDAGNTGGQQSTQKAPPEAGRQSG